MSDVMMMLGGPGGFQFSVATAAYESLRRSSAYRWQAQSRVRRRPAQQFLGPDAERIDLTGAILPHYRGGLGQIERMRQLAGRGVPLSLVAARLAFGEVMGSWCISTIEETQTEFTAYGAPLRIQFQLSLIAYGGDRR